MVRIKTVDIEVPHPDRCTVLIDLQELPGCKVLLGKLTVVDGIK